MRYGWIITWTQDDEPAGTIGPRGCLYSADAIKAQGREFRLLDDDGIHYYSGYYVGPDDESLFAPLDDYGLPNAGCTTIQYRDERGAWQTL